MLGQLAGRDDHQIEADAAGPVVGLHCHSGVTALDSGGLGPARSVPPELGLGAWLLCLHAPKRAAPLPQAVGLWHRRAKALRSGTFALRQLRALGLAHG